jgi:hypothetical protein
MGASVGAATGPPQGVITIAATGSHRRPVVTATHLRGGSDVRARWLGACAVRLQPGCHRRWPDGAERSPGRPDVVHARYPRPPRSFVSLPVEFTQRTPRSVPRDGARTLFRIEMWLLRFEPGWDSPCAPRAPDDAVRAPFLSRRHGIPVAPLVGEEHGNERSTA